MPTAIRSLWRTPAVADPPSRVWRDWLLLAVIVASAVVEALVRPDMTWRLVGLAVCIVLALATLWRRTHPLAALLVVVGLATIAQLAANASGPPPFGPYTLAFTLVLAYALVRWASGRDIVIGLTAAVVLQAVRSLQLGQVTDFAAGIVILMTAAALGVAVRSLASARQRQVVEYRLIEREQLARELHDTVAHHVSAIAIQAQAAQVVGAGNPEVVGDALRTIESEATRALAEMRTMVGALRDVSAPPVAPQRGVADLESLAHAGPDVPLVIVLVTGDARGLSPAVDAAVFRIAQESVTNALRHARGATRIEVAVVIDDARVSIGIVDDGEPAAAPQDPGFGLVGVAERVALLDGTFDAGPRSSGGWAVTAMLPRTGSRS